MINKCIHYCWFGGAPKSPLITTCIESWKKQLPDYEIIEWNESNSIFDCKFALQAAKAKKWAFLSDYVRIEVLAKHGGIYLDTDMLVLSSFDSLLSHQCFLGRQLDGQISAGIIGCIKNHPFINHCLTMYRNLEFDEGRLMNMAIPKILTTVYDTYADQNQVMLFSPDYFYPYSFEDSLKGLDYKLSIKENTKAVHLWNASWFTNKELAGLAFNQKKFGKALLLLISYFWKDPAKLLLIPGMIGRLKKRSK